MPIPQHYSDERKRPKTLEQRAAISASVRKAFAEGRGRKDFNPEVVAKRRRPGTLLVTQQLCERIIAYWCMQGYSTISAKPRAVKLESNSKYKGNTIVWEIETNIGPDGYPPRM